MNVDSLRLVTVLYGNRYACARNPVPIWKWSYSGIRVGVRDGEDAIETRESEQTKLIRDATSRWLRGKRHTPHRNCVAAHHHAGAASPPATSPAPPSSDVASPALSSAASPECCPALLGRGPAHCELTRRCPTSTASSCCRPPLPPCPSLCLASCRLASRERREGEGEREKGREERSCRKRKGRKRRKKRGAKKERRKEKERERKKKTNYLFIENMISKLYCLLLFGKENKM
jgi:hypothetical protein